MTFHNTWVLFFIPVVFVYGFIMNRRERRPGFQFSSLAVLSGMGSSARAILSRNMLYLRCIGIALMLVALARPQKPIAESVRRAEGIDIVLTIDVSSSMLAEDFTIGREKQNRLAVVKKVVSDFVSKRENDRLAVVVFGSTPHTIAPLTLNHAWILGNLRILYAGMLGDKTAIGSALAASLNRLKNSKAKGKVIILLTDGRNNAGKMVPATAAEIARSLGVKVYTVGAGTFGSVPYPVKNASGEVVGYKNVKIDIDEALLRRIAATTGGKYFRATDTNSLEKVYREIDRIEKAPIEERGYAEYEEVFPRFLIMALLLIICEVILSNTLLRRIP